MLSEKLDKIIAAENDASEKVSAAEKRASEIIGAAKAEAENIRLDKRNSARKKAKEMLDATESECTAVLAKYDADGAAEAEKLSKLAARNEMFGMSSVIIKIIP